MRISSVVAVARVSHRRLDVIESWTVWMAAMKPTVVSLSYFSFTFSFSFTFTTACYLRLRLRINFLVVTVAR